jgi:hypothetical protein
MPSSIYDGWYNGSGIRERREEKGRLSITKSSVVACHSLVSSCDCQSPSSDCRSTRSGMRRIFLTFPSSKGLSHTTSSRLYSDISWVPLIRFHGSILTSNSSRRAIGLLWYFKASWPISQRLISIMTTQRASLKAMTPRSFLKSSD